MVTSHPHRILFPIGAALAAVGVGHWLLHAVGLLEEYRSIFHAMVQIQAFMTVFAAGFLMTALPRRMEGPPPEKWEVALIAGAPLGVVLSAWLEMWIASQLFWWAAMIVLTSFVVRTLYGKRSKRRAPNAFVWIPASFATGLAGSLMAGARGALGDEGAVLHDIGRGLLLQGMFTGLIIGVGGMVFPLLTRKAPTPDGTDSARDRMARLAHLGAAALLAASFPIEVLLSLRLGLGLRAAVVLAELCFAIELWRLPSVAGWHRRLVWASGWLVAAGYVVGTVAPALATAALHVTFIGGFALLALSVSAHVSLAHAEHRGRQARVFSATASSVFLGAAITIAVLSRVLVDADPERFFVWLGVAAAGFGAALISWAVLVYPRRRAT